ncbi:hypothetical protein D3C79_808750 [compost metagenome]
MASGGQSGLAAATASCHQMSLWSCQATLPPVRLSTMTLLTLVSGWVSASSTFFLRGMGRPPRRPSSAVMTMEEPESMIRPERASGEKPPKTMLCTAPMRVQASMAMAASGTMGM